MPADATRSGPLRHPTTSSCPPTGEGLERADGRLELPAPRSGRVRSTTPGTTAARGRMISATSFIVATLRSWYEQGAPVEVFLPRLSTYVGHTQAPADTYCYLQAAPELLRPGGGTPGTRRGGKTMSTVAPLLEAFFTDRLMAQRNASAHTVAAYRDAFRLLLGFVYQQTGIPPAAMDLADLDLGMIAAFLDHLERDRANSTATRNARLAALRSFFRYAALHAPEHAGLIQRVLAIPDRRSQTQDVCFLTEDESRRPH